jgi:hypothetical protein
MLFLDEWVKDGIPPPPNMYPHVSDGTLVPTSSLGSPRIPGVNLPVGPLKAYHLDFGPEFKTGIITKEPPLVGKPFPTLVPQVDKDGNDLGGIRVPEVAVPIATYTGWNLRDPKIGAPTQMVSFVGSYIPFPKTRADRERSGDPRLSIAERYQSREQYVGMYAGAALELIRERFLLPEDLPAVLHRGEQEWDVAVK